MKKMIIYTDGGSRGNPGKAAVGVVFCNEKEQPIKMFSEYLGDRLTNNEAEYRAVILALKKLKAQFGGQVAKVTDVEVRSDSELLVNQMNGEYKVENENIQRFFMEVWNLKIDFRSVKFKSIPREKNRQADRLVNEALDAQTAGQPLF